MGCVYLHGVPGGPGECGLALSGETTARILAPDRFAMAPGGSFTEMIDALVATILARFPEEPLHIVGFSLGARPALEAALRLDGRVSRVDLVSAAAPFELGDFLPDMAGRPIFEAARDRPAALKTMVSLQSAMGRFVPGMLFALLFRGASGPEATLADRPEFKTQMARVYARAYGVGRPGLLREIAASVEPWAARVADLAAPVRVHHGVEDRWTPAAMGSAFRRLWPQTCRIEHYEGLGHYSTAMRVLPRLVGAA